MEYTAFSRSLTACPRYHPFVPHPPKSKVTPSLLLDVSLLKPGMRVAVALSGGADSVALLRALAERREQLGLVLHAAHLHHGLRGAEADGDLEFCRELAARLEIPFHEARVDTAAEARADARSGKAAETIEEAARRLRYAWFRELMSKGLPHAVVDTVATAHTLDDQAETVLAKFLRGAWTEGLSGIYPKLETAGAGQVVRPLLGVKRAEIEAYLRGLGQEWREDSSNRHLTFTRNRIRHELLPLLEGWNPRLREHLAQMAELARGEEAWWKAEVAKLAPQLILPGRPARGGGRVAGSGAGAGLAIETARLVTLAPAMQRRLMRQAAHQLGVSLDFPATEAVRTLGLNGRAGQRLVLPQGLGVERTARELRFAICSQPEATGGDANPEQQYSASIPGTIDAPAFGVRLRIERVTTKVTGSEPAGRDDLQTATLRNWMPGDRVRLRYSSGLRKVKEVLERKHVTGTERAVWPVLETGGQIAWMRGVELEPVPGLTITSEETGADSLMKGPKTL